MYKACFKVPVYNTVHNRLLHELYVRILIAIIIKVNCTAEPPNKGHFGSRAFVLFSEVVLWWEVRANMRFIAPLRATFNILNLYVQFNISCCSNIKFLHER